MKSRLRIITALLLALTLSGGVYAYTFATATVTIGIVEPTGDIATSNATETQPDWGSILDTEPGTETLRPNAAGTYAEGDPRGDTSNYLTVDEEVADEDATQVRNNSDGMETDTYNIPDHSEGGGSISSVKVYIRTKGTGAADRHAAETVIRTHGTNYFGDYTLLPLEYTDYSTTYGANPYTTDDWTWDEIDALEIGVRQYDNGGGEVRTTQVYVEVNFIAPPLQGDVPTGDLFEVTAHPDYTGDLAVKAYLVNTGNLAKAYKYLNMELYLEGSVEAGETPNYRLLTLENGVATFSIEGGGSDNHTLSVIGGSYTLNSRDTQEWEEGWTVIPEFYCEVTQR